ncbi:MAG TPA: Rieske 2Fe-2S domain-containing protein [Spongiibacteraceae bacterium]|nr:Rieske 2Fe-2S domain-containing protein [Spongiibacteraceae bacterium]
MSRYDFPIPYGWFYVGDAAALASGEIQTVRYFGQDWVLWRDTDGNAHLQEAYCPHLGAHIGVGGTVIGNTIECPFHKWTFNGDGSVAAIPYATRINEKACLKTLPLREHYGNLMAWYHPDNIAPIYELPKVPEIDSGDFRGPLSETHMIACCLQEMAENTVDGAHFQSIHQHPGAAEYEDVTFKDHLMSMSSKQLFPSSRGPVEGTLCTETSGFGHSVVRYKTLIEICMLASTAPVEKDKSFQIFQVYYKNPNNDPKIDRIGQAFYQEVNRQVRQDIPIWENKIYRAKPQLCNGDGPIAQFRKWASQFYVSEHATAL